ncbi:5-oxoprolinase subunit B family protein, partial [Tsukamurella soli]
RGAAAADAPPSTGDALTVNVRYDGPDLGDDDVALVAAHTAAPWTVAFCGFAPGFGYLVRDDVVPGSILWRPRRETSRPRVPAGSVALAAGYSAVYPRSSPGGWHLIGSTDAVMFDPERDPPALLTPGMRVRFVAG